MALELPLEQASTWCIAVEGLMNVMCTQLSHTKHRVILGGWQELFGVEVERSPTKGNRMKFFRTLVEDVQTRFNEFEWIGGVLVLVHARECSAA